jgi:aminoglycoside 6'-N-acetyltransferase
VLVDLRPLARADFPLLGRWLGTPHVHRWWHHQTTPEALERDFGPSLDGADPAQLRIAVAAGRPFGFVQHHRFDDNPGYRGDVAAFVEVPDDAISIDYFVGEPTMLGQGWGSAMIEAVLSQIWRDRPNAAVIVPVADVNVASRRVLERLGFRRAAVARLEPDNPVDGPEHTIYRIDASASAAW